MTPYFSPYLAQLLMDGLARRALKSNEVRGNTPDNARIAWAAPPAGAPVPALHAVRGAERGAHPPRGARFCQ